MKEVRPYDFERIQEVSDSYIEVVPDSFDYIEEMKSLHQLKDKNLSLFLKNRSNLREKSKFSLQEIMEYLEIGISKLKQEDWCIRRMAVLDEKTQTLDIEYYALDDVFDSGIKVYARKGTESDEDNKVYIKYLKQTGFMFCIGHKSFQGVTRKTMFNIINDFEEKQSNYLEDNFFHFPKEFDGLYDIIIDHINRKNNSRSSFTKKSH